MTDADPALDPVRRHLRFGWWSLLTFLSLGLVLEGLHGFKVRWYLDVANESRRLQWTLGHSHGTLLALVNVAYAFGLTALGPDRARVSRAASSCTIWAGILMPAGFLLGGAFSHGPDPGLAVALVPVGAVLLFFGIVSIARATDAWSGPTREAPPSSPEPGPVPSKAAPKAQGKRGAAGWSGKR